LHQRFLQAREMSEQFRAAWALGQLGLGGRQVLTPEAQWSDWASQSWIARIGLPEARIDDDWLRTTAETLLLSMVQDQIAYHQRNSRRLTALHHGLEMFGKTVVWLTFGIGLLFLLYVGLLWLVFDTTEPGKYVAAFVTIAGAFLPALATVFASWRYQGDFERFARRSARTARELALLDAALADFGVGLAGGSATVPAIASGTAFAQLREIVLRLDRVLTDDLDDWRYVYRARPNPEPG